MKVDILKLIALILAATAGTAFADTDVSYDKFKDVTTVTGEPTQLDTRTPHAQISLSAVATFSGNTCTGLPDSIGLLVSSRSSEWVFLRDQATMQAIFICDGDKQNIQPSGYRDDMKTDDGISSFCRETFLLPMDAETLEKFAAGTSVECQILNVEFTMSAADKASIHRMLQKIGDLPPDPPPPPAPIPSRVLKFDETERAKNDASVLDAARAALDAARTDAGKAFAQSKRSADLSRAVGDADDRRRNSTGEARLDASHDFLVAVKALEDAREDAIKSSPEYKSAFDSVTQALVTQANDKADYAAHPTTVPVDGLGPPPVP